MTYDETMKELKSMGTAQNVKIYTRHGAGENLFGVSFANLGKLHKKIKVDHELALKLWDSGNADARHLAAMIVDPDKMTDKELDHWAKTLSYYGIADMLAGVAVRTGFAQKKLKQWTASRDEWIGRAGWGLLSRIAQSDEELPDQFFIDHLEIIEKTVHQGKNFTRHAMMMALVAIGIRNTKLEKLAIEAAKRIGHVEVDHGETSCKTPDAIAYIKRAKARKGRKRVRH